MGGKNTLVFETDRLLVRRADPRVMTPVGFPNGLPIEREEITRLLLDGPDRDFDRLLVAAVRDSRAPIGECKLGRPDDAGIASTDVKLLPAHWGNGYGVEVKRGLLGTLFRRTDCRAVEATPNVDNAASIRMQEAVGGERVGEGCHEFPESMRDFTQTVRHYRYRVSREEWERRQREER